jgi:TonB family protein
MKNSVLVLLLLIPASLFSQQIKATSSFTISGEVSAPVTVNIADLKKWKEVSIGDLVITNHLGEKKSEAKGLKGILLKDILQAAEIKSESPKVLSEYYFVFIASDGYKVVYSWNELFNTATGDSVYIITEKNGKSISEMDDSILVVSVKDFKTGRRNVKGLASIVVNRVNTLNVVESTGDDSDKVYTFVEQSAEPVGGLERFYQWIRRTMKYPASVRTGEIEGNVLVKFVIEPTGAITNPTIVKGLDSDCDNEAIRLMSMAPKWKPGRMSGKAVRQNYTMPISFRRDK